MQSETSKVVPETSWIDVQKAWFLPYEKLGVMEHLVQEALNDSSKRKRQAALRNVTSVLKNLRLLDFKGQPAGLAFGCLSTGERGLFVFSAVSVQLRQADLPSKGEGNATSVG